MAPVLQAGKQMGEVTRLGKLRELQARRLLPVAGGAVLMMVCLPKTSLVLFHLSIEFVE